MENKFKPPGVPLIEGHHNIRIPRTPEETMEEINAELKKAMNSIYEPIIKEHERKYSMRIRNNSDALEEIKKLKEEYPNDQEFGEKVRTYLEKIKSI